MKEVLGRDDDSSLPSRIDFGGKSRIADAVWQRFGNVPNMVEPFFGSGAVLLARPHEAGIETVNDIDCALANFWRALIHDPEGVAEYADRPVSELDLHAIHRHLVTSEDSKKFREAMRSDIDFYDVKFAGYWVFGMSCWIGSGWCAGAEGGESEKIPHLSTNGQGLARSSLAEQLPHLSDAGPGVHSTKLPSLGDAGRATSRVSVGTRQGLFHKRQNLNNSGKGVTRERLIKTQGIYDYLAELSHRLRRVRVCCGDWTRVLGPSVTEKLGVTAVFLDPPYGAEAERHTSLYAHDSLTVAAEVREWAIAHGDNPNYRVAICGYGDEHDTRIPKSWERYTWKTTGGYGTQGNGQGRKNKHKEMVWFSPHCLKPTLNLFGEEENTEEIGEELEEGEG